MNWVKGFALATCLSMPLSVIVAAGASAEPAAAPKAAEPAKKAPLTDAEKKAKSTDCSKQADAKKLHGDERRKFRSACLRG